MSESNLAKQNSKRRTLGDRLAKYEQPVLIDMCHVLYQFSQNLPELVAASKNEKLDKSQVKNLKDAAIILKSDYQVACNLDNGSAAGRASAFICKFDEMYNQKKMPNLRDLGRKIFEKSVKPYDVQPEFVGTLKGMNLHKAVFVLQKSKQRFTFKMTEQ